ncbi:MAG: IS630 family transposase [Acidobacteria bacterium]|nr:MAG: IS630 family transposase [Acidobacteriota bacterium]
MAFDRRARAPIVRAPGSTPPDWRRRPGGTRPTPHSGRSPERSHPLEQSCLGNQNRTESIHRQPHLAGVRTASPSQRGLPAVQPSPAGRPGARHRRPVHEPTEPRTHDYQRHGTTSLFAALEIATGSVIGKCWPRPRALEFRKFLQHIDRALPADLAVHLVLDNYATHKTQEIRQWFLRHPRYTLHFTPTHSSWLNQVERWFGLLSQRQIKRGSHYSVRELEAAIAEFIAIHNPQPKPFVWTKSADDILNSIGRFASRTLAEHGANNI